MGKCTLKTGSDRQPKSIAEPNGTADAGHSSSLLTIHDAARILNVPVSWVYEHVRSDCSNRLPHVKLGKYLRFSRADIESYLASLRSRRG